MNQKLSKSKSEEWFKRAKAVIPGGVNSPVRAFTSVGETPPFITKGSGAYLWDEEGNQYIDYVCSWGPLILGHTHPEIVKAVKRAAENGLTFGAATRNEVILAEIIQSAIPSIQKLRLVTSGTEAAMTSVRLARAFTGKKIILKFEGCYHGHADPFLVKAGSGLLTFGTPSSRGIPEEVSSSTLVAQYNAEADLDEIFMKQGKDIACVIVEPVAGNMGVVLPKPGFLEKLSSLCRQTKTVLIFDEVITGFRTCYGGYQNLCGISPDLTCLGKIIGGGLPMAAVGGKNEIMSLLSPEGPVYQAGTLAGNPAAVAAGIATLEVLNQKKKEIYEKLEQKTAWLTSKIKSAAGKLELTIRINRIGSMFTLFFADNPVETFSDVISSHTNLYKPFFKEMLENGIYLPPSAFEAWFVSTAHRQQDLEKTAQYAEKAFIKVKGALTLL